MAITRLRLPDGVSNSGLTNLGAGDLFTTGNVLFVDSTNGSDGNLGTDPKAPLRTIGQAQTSATASNGDIVIIKPGYTESRTAVLTLSKAGVTYIGLGQGSLAPTITIGTNAVDVISITGANVVLRNFFFPAPAIDQATAMINVAAANVSLYDIRGIGSTTAKAYVDCITIASGANDLTIDGFEIYNTVAAVNSFISIEAAVARFKLFNAFAFGDVTTAGIIDGATATQIHFRNVSVGVVGTTKAASTLDSNPTGMIEDSFFSGTSTTLANNGANGSAVRSKNVWLLEETDNSKQGVQIPAVDAD